MSPGSIYRFELTSNRKSLQLTGPLVDRIVNANGVIDEDGSITFGTGFGVTSDLLNGPGGMFVVSLSNGSIYRISQNPNGGITTRAVPEPGALMGIVLVSMLGMCRRRRDPTVTSHPLPCTPAAH